MAGDQARARLHEAGIARRVPCTPSSASADLEAGKQALSQGSWVEARRSFQAAQAVEETPEVVEGLGWAALWLDDGDAAITAFEQAHRLYVERLEPGGAARAAIWLAWSYGSFRGQYAVAGGWVERARRLLEGLETRPEHAWLAAFGGLRALGGGDIEAATALAREAAEVGRSVRRPDLEALGLALEGEALVAEGRFVDGMRLLDGAAATAIASGTDDFACVTATCCSMLAACELTGDVDRASQWCDLTTDYALRYGLRNIFVICRTSYAGVLISCGHWEEAEAELERAAREFAEIRPRAAGQAIARLAELRRRQGRFSEAAALFEQVRGRRDALLGSAALALDRGELERAADLAQRFMRQTPRRHRARRALALEVLTRARAERSEFEAAAVAVEELQSIASLASTEPLQALCSSAAGALAAAEGEPDRARTYFEDAVDLFSRCGSPFEAGRARLDLAGALRDLGRRSSARDEAEAARAAFAELGAGHALERAARIVSGLEEEREDDGRPPATELSPRELEVLGLIAVGLTNQEIATRLVISDHTVHRHVSNIFRKLGVGSRSAATAYAHRHGLV